MGRPVELASHFKPHGNCEVQGYAGEHVLGAVQRASGSPLLPAFAAADEHVPHTAGSLKELIRRCGEAMVVKMCPRSFRIAPMHSDRELCSGRE